MDDSALVAAIGRGDVRAMRLAAERHARDLHRLAYRMLGESSEAEDITQETMLRLWTGAGKWRPIGGGLAGWLRRVATNLCLDRLRRRRWLADEDTAPERADDTLDAPDMLDSARLARLARSAVLGLPDRQRAAVVLTYYEELPNAAAAEILDMNLKAFESLLFRARATLKVELSRAGVGADAMAGTR